MTVLLVILNILKVIGFILLGIIGLLLIIVIVVLVAPIHYRIEGLSEDEMHISARVTYFARCVLAKVSYAKGSGLEILASVLWGRIKILPKDTPDYTKDFAAEEPGDEIEAWEEPEVDITSDEPVDRASEIPGDKPDEEPGDDIDLIDDLPDGRKAKKKRRKKSKDVKEGGGLREKISAVKEKWLTESNGRAVLYIKKQLVYILKKYAPRRAKGHLAYSTGDPALTGEIFGALWLLPFMYKGKFGVTPDFEAEKFYAKGILVINGYIQLGVVLIAVLRLVLNKDTRRMIKLFIEQ